LSTEIKDDDNNKNKILPTKSNEIKLNKNSNKNQKIKAEGEEARKWSNTSTTTITEDNLNGKKTGKIVLKIKPPKDGMINLQQTTKYNNSSSSPSSSSSSSISTSINICQTFQQAIESQQQTSQQPVARLSSSGAPPSKLKQQTLQHQQNKSGIKRTAIDDIIENVKFKKAKKEGKNSLSPPTQQQRLSSISSNIKSLKENKKNNTNLQQKEMSSSSVVKQTTFPNLKNFKVILKLNKIFKQFFKIPKVVEAEPTPSSQQQQQIPSLKTEQQTLKNFSGGDGKINKHLDSSTPSSSSYGGGDFINSNSRRYGGEKKSLSGWDKTSNYLPQHVRQQKNQKPSNGKHPYNDSNRNKKFGGGPPNMHNERFNLNLF
jgi:hypothetical protein